MHTKKRREKEIDKKTHGSFFVKKKENDYFSRIVLLIVNRNNMSPSIFRSSFVTNECLSRFLLYFIMTCKKKVKEKEREKSRMKVDAL
jgi:hypothetical protein